MSGRRHLNVIIIILFLASCKASPYASSVKSKEVDRWMDKGNVTEEKPQTQQGWWLVLNDKLINLLIDRTYAANSSLKLVAARIDEARANLSYNKSGFLPELDLQTNGNASRVRARGKNPNPPSELNSIAPTIYVKPLKNNISKIDVQPSISWELDLFGKIRSMVEVAQLDLNAREADAENTRLLVAAEISDLVIDLRTCLYSAKLYKEKVKTLKQNLSLTDKRLTAGISSFIDQSNMINLLVSQEKIYSEQNKYCSLYVNSLVAISGSSTNEIYNIIEQDKNDYFIPSFPKSKPGVPAKILAEHPNIVVAEREAQAAWASIAVAKVESMPKIDLSSAFAGQWITTSGSNLVIQTISMLPSIGVAIFDGGRGRANISASESRYYQAEANLQAVLRNTVMEVENALAEQKAAEENLKNIRKAYDSEKRRLKLIKALWSQGSADLIDLGNSRCSYADAEINLISAKKDLAKSHVSLIRATGNILIDEEG